MQGLRAKITRPFIGTEESPVNIPSPYTGKFIFFAYIRYETIILKTNLISPENMILSNLDNSQRAETLDPRFKQVFDYVKSHDLLHSPCGRIELDGDRLFINNDNPTCIPQEKQQLEVHRRYIDIHFLLEGTERIGWKALEELTTESKAYDEKADIAFYADRPTTYVDLFPGHFLIVYPEDAHAPIIGNGTIRKAVAKIRIQ